MDEGNRLGRSSSYLNHTSGEVSAATNKTTTPSQIDLSALGKRDDDGQDAEQMYPQRSSSFLNHSSGGTGSAHQKTKPNAVDFSALSAELNADLSDSSSNESSAKSNAASVPNSSSSQPSQPSSPQLSGSSYAAERDAPGGSRRPYVRNDQMNYWNNWPNRGAASARGYRGGNRVSRGQSRRANYTRPRNGYRGRGNDWYGYRPQLGQQYFWQDPPQAASRSRGYSMNQNDSHYSNNLRSDGNRGYRVPYRSWNRGRSGYNYNWKQNMPNQSGRYLNQPNRVPYRSTRGRWMPQQYYQPDRFDQMDGRDQEQYPYGGTIPRGTSSGQPFRGKMNSFRGFDSAASQTSNTQAWGYPVNPKQMGYRMEPTQYSNEESNQTSPNSDISSVNSSLVSTSISSDWSSYASDAPSAGLTVTKTNDVARNAQEDSGQEQN